ncbi:MAG: putative sulfate exporter family transporter [Herpetosiphon sp.]
MIQPRSTPNQFKLPAPIAVYGPGILLATAVSALSIGLQWVEIRVIGQPVIEGLVIAILLGMVIRTAWGASTSTQKGVDFTAKQVLEAAIVLLGASVDLPALLKAGPIMLAAIVGVVVVGIIASTVIGRSLGLNPKLAILVACGNSICGNSAIAAVAPVIGADDEDVVSSIALTAVLGVAVVLLLPLLIPLLRLSFYQYGVLAGMTVYAVPQVLAATFPVSALSGEIGTLVKLVRVLLLGPVVLFFAFKYPQPATSSRFSLNRFIPWFIAGFLLLAVARSSGILPLSVAAPLREISKWLTVAAMAGLGLGVDMRSVRKVGLPVAVAVLGSLAVLIAVSIFAIKGLHING